MTRPQPRSAETGEPSEAPVAAHAPKTSRLKGPPTSGRTALPQGRRQPTPSVKPMRLHEAIIVVLEDAGQPLTANDIAARIRERDLFQPPRSGRELRGGQVSARVGNATYRDRFVRRPQPKVQHLQLVRGDVRDRSIGGALPADGARAQEVAESRSPTQPSYQGRNALPARLLPGRRRASVHHPDHGVRGSDPARTPSRRVAGSRSRRGARGLPAAREAAGGTASPGCSGRCARPVGLPP